jgi:predicted Rossmann-fold nucleotide-binding protein
VLNIDHYFDAFEAMIATAVEEGFIRPEYAELLVVEHDVETLLKRIETFEPVGGVTKWIDLVET